MRSSLLALQALSVVLQQHVVPSAVAALRRQVSLLNETLRIVCQHLLADRAALEVARRQLAEDAERHTAHVQRLVNEFHEAQIQLREELHDAHMQLRDARRRSTDDRRRLVEYYRSTRAALSNNISNHAGLRRRLGAILDDWHIELQ